jgi:UPF0755 protein
MKRIFQILALVFLFIILYTAWIFFAPATTFKQPKQYLYLKTGQTDKESVLQSIHEQTPLKHPYWFQWLAGKLNLWQRIKPGKYEIKKGSSIFSVVRMLRNNRQVTVNLVITKLRTKNDLAGLIGRKFECDSVWVLQFLQSQDSVKLFDQDTNTVMSMVLPDTYTFYWATTPRRIFEKLKKQHDRFWNTERTQKAKQIELTTQEVYTLASIVEEETLQNDEKSLIASVYLNRLKKGMNLGADPTIKFAVGDFTIKRVLLSHINSSAANPYNTYKNKGLPPGPICTPTANTIDAVLNVKPTNYLYFCAKPNSNGHHAFAQTGEEHLKNAKLYQQWLNEIGIK